MIRWLFGNIKIKFTIVMTVFLVAILGLCTLGCSDESISGYAIRIAKEEFGCEKILWYNSATYRNELTNVYLYDERYISTIPAEYFEPERGGVYVLGVDKFGSELFIAVPNQKSVEKGMRYSPRLIQWPFAYSFREIANFAAEYGYKYADGIEGHEEEYQSDYFKSALTALDNKDDIIYYFKAIFSDAEKKYDELDVKFVLRYTVDYDGNPVLYYVTQEGGKLKLYENKKTDLGDVTEIIYERDKKAE